MFCLPQLSTVKKDDSIKLALDAKPINGQLFENNYQMPNADELLDGVSQIVTANAVGTLYFTVLDLNYAYSQLKLTAETSKQFNFNIVGGGGGASNRDVHVPYGLLWSGGYASGVSKSHGLHVEPRSEQIMLLRRYFHCFEEGQKIT